MMPWRGWPAWGGRPPWWGWPTRPPATAGRWRTRDGPALGWSGPGGCLERAEGVGVEREVGGGQVLLKVPERGGAGDEEHRGRQVEQPGQRHLGRRGAQATGHLSDGGRAEDRVVGVEGRTEREERHEGHAVADAGRQHVGALTLHQVEGILHAGDLHLALGPLVLGAADVAEPDGPDQALRPQRGHGTELLVEGDVS